MTAIMTPTQQPSAFVTDLVDGRYRLVEPLPDGTSSRSGAPMTLTAYDERLNRYVVLELVSTDHEPTGMNSAGLHDLVANRPAMLPAILDAGAHSHPDGTYLYVVSAQVREV